MKKRIKRFITNSLRHSFHQLVFALGWLWLLAVVSPVSLAQPPPTKPPTVARDDRSPLRVRYPDAEHLRDLQTDRDYQYGRDAPPPENPVSRFFFWLLRKIAEFFRSEAYENVGQYVILVAVAALAIYLLMKAEVLGFLFPKKAAVSSMDYENLAENIQEIDFDTAIDESITARNLRLAVRLLYLQTLKYLTNAGHIAYKSDKTNRQYVQELADSALQSDFEKLTRQFEFIWYGNFPVEETQFHQIRHQFKQFSQALYSTNTVL